MAGSGADAAPYFRVFNPILQGEKFDPDGVYVRRWLPELAQLPDKLIHQPWTATPLELASAGIELGKTYPPPIVDHKAGRERALAPTPRSAAARLFAGALRLTSSTAAAQAIMPAIATASSRSSNNTKAISEVTAGTR